MPYQSNRQQDTNNLDNNNESFDEEASRKNQERQNASKKALKVAAKGAANRFTGPVGGKVVDTLSKTKLGDKALNKGAAVINKMPGVGRTAKMLNDTGITDKADKTVGGIGKKDENIGGGHTPSSSPSSASEKNDNNSYDSSSDNSSSRKRSSSRFSDSSYSDDKNNDSESSNSEGNFSVKLLKNPIVHAIVIFIIPILLAVVIFLSIISTINSFIINFVDAFGISTLLGLDNGNYDVTPNESQSRFYEDVKSVVNEYENSGKYVDPITVIGVFQILNNYDARIEYDDIKTSDIREVANSMFLGNSYDEDTFKDNLINDIIPKYLPDTIDTERSVIASDIINYSDDYYSLIGVEKPKYTCTSNGTCEYPIKGFYIPNTGDVSANIQVSDLKVKLIECKSPYNQVANTKLIDFEDYIAGVAYAEVGPNASDEVIKTQMVIARSFALARPTATKDSQGKKLSKEGNNWVLQISSCSSDQLYCSIDEGCSNYSEKREPLDSNHKIRRISGETQGEVLVNSKGNIIYTDYNAVDKKNWQTLANKGYDYKQILIQYYNSIRKYDAKQIQKNSCSNGNSKYCLSSGAFASWKQFEGSWIDIPVGTGGTIRSIGCAATSVAIQIAKSGVPTNVKGEFNPGSFVEYMNSHNGFVNGGNIDWTAVSRVAPTFRYENSVYVLPLSRNEKFERIKSIVNQNNVYAVAEVKGNTGQHWVAIDSISGNTINMMDPGSRKTDMWAEYSPSNTSMIVYFRVNR